MLRRGAICLLTLSLMWLPPAQADDKQAQLWPALKQQYFGDRPIRKSATDLLSLEAPKRAEDAAIVPVSIKSLQPQTASARIRSLYLFIDHNPMPHAARFDISERLMQINIATRVRVDRYTPMRLVAEMQDGSLHMVETFVKASGGCSAPVGRDHTAALARLGKMQIRMRQPKLGEPNPVQVIISHPNNSGLQMDQQTRGYIPAHFVKTLAISFRQQPLITLHAGISISEDPSLRFVFSPRESGVLMATATDSKGHLFQQEKHL